MEYLLEFQKASHFSLPAKELAKKKMALLAEQIVEEWLNRRGYFTMRGIKHGVNEVDLLGIRSSNGTIVGVHVEVQVSVNPNAYISKLDEAAMKQRLLEQELEAKQVEAILKARASQAGHAQNMQHTAERHAMEMVKRSQQEKK